MKNIVFVYDNISRPSNRIKTIIGEKSFADIILKRKKLYEKYSEILDEKKYIKNSFIINNDENLHKMKKVINGYENVNIVHLFSNFIYTDQEKFDIILDKSRYINENIIVKDNDDVVMLMYNNQKDYYKFIDNYSMKKEMFENSENEVINSDAFTNLCGFDNFLKYISGGFDARFFNSMVTSENIVVKKSNDKEKIKKEYTYYHLLPDEAKKWMVMPYNYNETDKSASYEMERLYMPDLAIRYVHGAIDEKEMESILDKLFFYITTRERRIIDKDKFINDSNSLYIKKLKDRIDNLKKHPQYDVLKNYIKNGTYYNDIDEAVDEYERLYKLVLKSEKKYYEVIGHGDLCFSNILYNNETKMIKFIDPKGALKESELWTNPYYDIAKISHSVCGLYDFFNCGLYDIRINEDLKFDLTIKYNGKTFIELFKRKLEQYGYNYNNIRIYEASLFLSMLPLHMDYPKKVFGFLLNGINIMNQINES